MIVREDTLCQEIPAPSTVEAFFPNVVLMVLHTFNCLNGHSSV